MEYLLTMTTRVPEGTSDAEVQDVRDHEAARSRELATEGHLLRLWRPPLQPGEWRTLGLFAADDAGSLEQDLASMPLRVWRTDEVTPLEPHPNDPAPGAAREAPAATDDVAEFLTTFTVVIPPDTADETVEATVAGEGERTRELAREGHLRRLWALPGEGRALGLWAARDDAQLQELLASLPMDPWLEVQTTPLSPHPSDPGVERSRPPARA